MVRKLTIWALVGWTVASVGRWGYAFYSLVDDKYVECTRRGFGQSWQDEDCVRALEVQYSGQFRDIWQEWWMLMVVLCLIWLMVRYREK